MSAADDLAQLGKMVAAQHGWPAAKAFKAYRMDDADQARLTASALDILKVFPKIPGAGALLSAAFAVRLEQVLKAPIQVVAGTLTVANEPVFASRSEVPIEALAAGSADWDGHVWVMVGAYVADISIFRSAYSNDGPAALSRHVDLMFGPDKALYVDDWKRTRRMGLGYRPQHVLGRDDVTALMQGAFRLIEEHRANQGG